MIIKYALFIPTMCTINEYYVHCPKPLLFALPIDILCTVSLCSFSVSSEHNYVINFHNINIHSHCKAPFFALLLKLVFARD